MSHYDEKTISEAIKNTEQLLQDIDAYKHPLLILLRESLKEQKARLTNLKAIFKNESVLLEDIKTDCAAAYHANQITTPFFEDWQRAIYWLPEINESSKSEFKSIKNSISQISENFTNLARQLENEFGKLKIRYFIPAPYLSEERLEEK